MIDRPEVITNCNASIGGVDKEDILISLYRPKIKLKKWTIKLIAPAFDIAVTNSSLEYKYNANNLGISYKNQLDLLVLKKNGVNLITVGKSCRMSAGILPLKRGHLKSHSGSQSSSPVPEPARKRILIDQQPSNEMRLEKLDHFSRHDNNPHDLVCKRTGCLL